MSSDPVGTIGLRGKSDPALDDIALAYKGGPVLADRMASLAAAKDAHDQAFAQLQLGKDVLSKRSSASAELARAQEKHAEASDVLARAEAAAVATLEEAAKVAFEIRAKATEFMHEAEAYVARKRAEAEGYFAGIKKTVASKQPETDPLN